MRILSFKPGHDGSIAILEDSKLILSLEAEKDSFGRYIPVTPTSVIGSMSYLSSIPDVIAMGGWVTGAGECVKVQDAGYLGHDETAILTKKIQFIGKEIEYFSSSHERSHLLGAYGMSPFEQGEPCYILIWEGVLGNFYEIDEKLTITKIGKPLHRPGDKYSFLFALADPEASHIGDPSALAYAGKLMALAAFSDLSPTTQEEQEVIEYIISSVGIESQKTELKHTKHYNIGVESNEFKQLAGKFSEALFHKFYDFAKVHLTKKLPLLIAGGCGLNCDWNSKWKECGLFPAVFIPPCANDSGSAIGTAIDAQLYYTGKAKISWDVYAGEPFVYDCAVGDDFEVFPLDYQQVATFLHDNKVIGWVQGRWEIGPRALGNRSILAAPFETAMLDRLNQIKQRESYRPIAPVCREEEVSEHFAWTGESPYMLFFQRLKTNRLKAVTHVDNSARVQTVNQYQNEKLYHLLSAFKSLTGFGVLCNTSLNFKGRGFINRMSDMEEYCKNRLLDGFVVEDKFYVLRKQ